MTQPDTIAIIPARGGSVRMPRKNITPFMGRPLIHWTVRAALDSGSIDRAIVTTDDPAIARAAVEAGAECPFLRPAHLATSETTTLDVVLHLFDALDATPDCFVLMQPTSPLRFAEDVSASHAMLTARGAPAVVSVCPVDKPWAVFRRCDADRTLCPVPPPEGGPPDHQLNGALYWSRPATLRETRSFTPEGCLAYVMTAEASVDIDTALDFTLAETIARTMPERFV